MYLTNRNALGSNLNCLDLIDTFIEVGVLKGDFSSTVAGSWKGKSLILIDSWTQLPSSNADYTGGMSQQEHDENYHYVQTRFKDDSRIKAIKGDSVESAKNFSNIDCVYLDADHSYVGATKDINAWWGTIKDGGLLTGHDYVNCFWGDPQKDPRSTWTGVRLAVEHFFKNRTDCSCIISAYEDATPSWHVFKNETKIDPKDILVLSCATDNLQYSYKTEINHKEYCNRHGYSYEMVRDSFWGDVHPAWSKLKFTHERLPHYKWVMWVDADAVFVNQNKKVEKFLIPRMGHVSSTWHAFGRLQLTNGISFWQNMPWTFDFLKSAISFRGQFGWHGVWEEEGIRRAMDLDIGNYGRWLGIETAHFNAWPHYNAWNQGDDLIHHWGGVKFCKDKLIDDSIAMSKVITNYYNK